jgi:hypothetical protein
MSDAQRAFVVGGSGQRDEVPPLRGNFGGWEYVNALCLALRVSTSTFFLPRVIGIKDLAFAN